MSFNTELKKISKITTNKTLLFRYTKKFNLNTDIKEILNTNYQYNKIYLSYDDNNFYLGIGKLLSFEVQTKKELLTLKNKCSLKNYQIISSGIDQNAPIKFFGGVAFNIDKDIEAPWSDEIPKSIFSIPKILIFNTNKNINITFSFLIDNDDDIKNSYNTYNNFEKSLNIQKNNISTSVIETTISPTKKEYSNIFNNYMESINKKKIDKIVLSRMKTFTFNDIILKNNLFNNTNKNCTDFLIDFNLNYTFFGSTPEKLIEVNNNKIYSEAIAGTVSKDEDNNNLMNDNKELYEHQYVVNHILEKLKPFLKNINKPTKPLIKSLNHIKHLFTPIHGETTTNIHILELLYNLYPTSAVLGFPDNYVLNMIKKSEPFDRGWYSGCIGWFDTNGNGRFDVAIRSALMNSKHIHFFSGGGIVKGSLENKEWDETELKFQQLTSAISNNLK